MMVLFLYFDFIVNFVNDNLKLFKCVWIYFIFNNIMKTFLYSQVKIFLIVFTH